MNPTPLPNRCRLVLIAPEEAVADGGAAFAARLSDALSGGDVASVIFPLAGPDEAALQAFAQAVVPVAQEAGAAAIIAGDNRIAARVQADGVHVEGSAAALEEALRLQPKLMVGTGGAATRDDALALGELRPDYVFFGRLGYDRKPEPHKRNLELGRWWAELIEIPCIVLGGSDLASVEDVAATGAEFVALSAAVFAGTEPPGQAVARANELLDRTAPKWD